MFFYMNLCQVRLASQGYGGNSGWKYRRLISIQNYLRSLVRRGELDKDLTAVLKVSNVLMLRIVEGNAFQR